LAEPPGCLTVGTSPVGDAQMVFCCFSFQREKADGEAGPPPLFFFSHVPPPPPPPPPPSYGGAPIRKNPLKDRTPRLIGRPPVTRKVPGCPPGSGPIRQQSAPVFFPTCNGSAFVAEKPDPESFCPWVFPPGNSPPTKRSRAPFPRNRAKRGKKGGLTVKFCRKGAPRESVQPPVVARRREDPVFPPGGRLPPVPRHP